VCLRIAVRTGEPTAGLRDCERLEPGAILGRYKVIGFLGKGSMGRVYRARDTELARDVALKCINRKRFDVAQAQVLLRREAQAMAQVEHSAVIRIYDVGISVKHLFVAMELARGGTLSEWVGVRPRGWREVIRTFIEAGRGLAAAHHAGLIHCDIKPGNILFDAHGHAKISDFGLARMASTQGRGNGADASFAGNLDVRATWTGAIEGTLPYMAPEQLIGGPIDARADQFAFCVSLWEALCGRRPFRGLDATLSPEAFLRAITRGYIDDLGPAAPIPRRVLGLIRRGLAAERSQRWGSMNDLLDALDRAARRRCKSGLPLTGYRSDENASVGRSHRTARTFGLR
jgi:serine/threonine protein kinase